MRNVSRLRRALLIVGPGVLMTTPPVSASRSDSGPPLERSGNRL